jgi:hypothetical protein
VPSLLSSLATTMASCQAHTVAFATPQPPSGTTPCHHHHPHRTPLHPCHAVKLKPHDADIFFVEPLYVHLSFHTRASPLLQLPLFQAHHGAPSPCIHVEATCHHLVITVEHDRDLLRL